MNMLEPDLAQVENPSVTVDGMLAELPGNHVIEIGGGVGRFNRHLVMAVGEVFAEIADER